ncbi:hypothetical protein TW86_22750, partial [Halomonas sp. S2151]
MRPARFAAIVSSIGWRAVIPTGSISTGKPAISHHIWSTVVILIFVDNTIIIIIDIDAVIDAITIRVETSAITIVKVSYARHSVRSIRADVVVTIEKGKVPVLDQLVVGVIAIIGIRSLEDVEQTVAIGIGFTCDGPGPGVALGDIL